MFQIVIGGLGFSVWNNIVKKKTNFRKYSLQSKIVIFTTLILIIVPAIYFYFFEFNKLTGSTRILSSLFQSVTTRTAGFNTADFSEMKFLLSSDGDCVFKLIKNEGDIIFFSFKLNSESLYSL